MKAYDYQEQGVEAIRDSYRHGCRAPLYVLPTGGGKTFVFTYITKAAAAKGSRVLILVHRVELVRQTSEALRKFGVYHGLINPNYKPDISANVQVASVQTLVKRLHRYAAPDLIIVDEAHHASAGTWRTIIAAYPQAKVLGVTATPIRGDGQGLDEVFDDMIVGPQIADLIQRGFLVKPIVYAPKEKLDLTGLRTRMGDYEKTALAELMDKPTITGDVISTYTRLCPGTTTVVFCVSVAHAEHVAEQFNRAGYLFKSIDGKMDDETRKRILSDLEHKRIHGITSCDLVSEGTDIPVIETAILLRPTQSLALYIQQIGRALRKSQGKQFARIIDHVGNVLLHGMPDAIREWTLQGEKVRRGKRELSLDESLKVKQCMNCFAFDVPVPVCRNCGHVHPIEERDIQHVDGELIEVSEEAAELLRVQKRREEARAQTYEDLLRIEKERGYKSGWARYRWEARQRKQVA
jgi:superfamily II DNA or RNA helicase